MSPESQTFKFEKLNIDSSSVWKNAMQLRNGEEQGIESKITKNKLHDMDLMVPGHH